MIKDFYKEVLDKVEKDKVVRMCCKDGIDIRIKIAKAVYTYDIGRTEHEQLYLTPYLDIEANAEVYQKGKVIFDDTIESFISEGELEILLSDDNCLLTQSSDHQCEELMKYTLDDIIIDDIYIELLDRLKVEKGVIINDCKFK